MSEFIVQSHRKKKNRKSKKSSKTLVDRDSSPAEVNIEKVLQQIENCEFELRNSEFYQQAIEALDKSFHQAQLKEVICLGIGRIGECSIAKHQLAFISIVAKHFGVSSIKFFDPVLSSCEKQLLEALNYEVLSENKEGKYIATDPTLFYLPHCPKQITNYLLFANWSPKRLENIFLISNSFKTIIDSTPERLLRPNAHFILEANPLVTEFEIRNIFKFTDIFNDFSVHSFLPENLDKVNASFWEIHPTPNYAEDDLELITNGSN